MTCLGWTKLQHSAPTLPLFELSNKNPKPAAVEFQQSCCRRIAITCHHHGSRTLVPPRKSELKNPVLNLTQKHHPWSIPDPFLLDSDELRFLIWRFFFSCPSRGAIDRRLPRVRGPQFRSGHIPVMGIPSWRRCGGFSRIGLYLF